MRVATAIIALAAAPGGGETVDVRRD